MIGYDILQSYIYFLIGDSNWIKSFLSFKHLHIEFLGHRSGNSFCMVNEGALWEVSVCIIQTQTSGTRTDRKSVV